MYTRTHRLRVGRGRNRIRESFRFNNNIIICESRVPQGVYNGNNVSGTSCIIDRQRRSVCTRVLTSQRVNANNITTIRIYIILYALK